MNTDRRTLGTVLVAGPAAVGMIFCLLNASGAELLCLTQGCGIYAGYALLGLPIEWLGVGGFALILLLALAAPRSVRFQRPLLWVLAGGLFIDTLFLVWQILYWPCSSCLVVALLLALCLLGARRTFPDFRLRAVRLILILWFAAFMPVAVTAAKEVLLQPWPARGPADAPVAVYFSPTCQACQKAVQELLDLPDLADRVAFLPVAKNAEDLRRLSLLPDRGSAADLRALFSPVAEAAGSPGLGLRWRIARNKMALASLGADRVPLLLSTEVVKVPEPAGQLPYSGGAAVPQDPFAAPAPVPGCSAASSADEACQ